MTPAVRCTEALVELRNRVGPIRPERRWGAGHRAGSVLGLARVQKLSRTFLRETDAWQPEGSGKQAEQQLRAGGGPVLEQDDPIQQFTQY